MTTAEQVTAECPCGHELWKRRAGEWTLANRVLKLREDGQLWAKCPKCRRDVVVPWLRIEPPPPVSRRLVVRLDLDSDSTT